MRLVKVVIMILPKRIIILIIFVICLEAWDQNPLQFVTERDMVTLPMIQTVHMNHCYMQEKYNRSTKTKNSYAMLIIPDKRNTRR
jgi:hypothetical protein